MLVADSEPEVRRFVRAVLLRKGYEVLEAEDGAAAYELLQRRSGAVQLLVTEVQLPRMDGITLGRKVSADYPNTEVLYVAGFLSEPLTGVPIGRFLPKPFLGGALAHCVQSLLD